VEKVGAISEREAVGYGPGTTLLTTKSEGKSVGLSFHWPSSPHRYARDRELAGISDDEQLTRCLV